MRKKDKPKENFRLNVPKCTYGKFLRKIKEEVQKEKAALVKSSL
jgi:hypothetical protein